ncbi:MAG: 30S ribosomal protein S9 [Planctomycetota bacterium]|nr:MAG: 30S ribosomal protein S9 [Planctomycetota bacterium]
MPKTTHTDKEGNVLYYLGTGRRKSAVARVRLRAGGSGQITVNKRPFDDYVQRDQDRILALSPLRLIGATRNYDVFITVRGGGIKGQAGAMRHGIARALAAADESAYQKLKDAGLLTRDARRVERKKPGKAGARASFQFSKR